MPREKPRVVVLTGASLGLGKAIAYAFVQNGDDVVIAARTSETLEETAGELRKINHGRVESVVCDIATKDGRAKLIETAAYAFGAVDILINNAGTYGPIGPLEENDEDGWVESIQTNLIAPAMLMRAVVPVLRKKGGGHIINISGGGATKPTPTFSAYATAKAGVVRLTETLALEVAPYNIRVNAIAPGFIATRFHLPVLSGETKVDATIAASTKKNMERGGDDPKLAGTLCLFLTSPDASHINGRLISAVFDDREELKSVEPFRSDGYYTLRRVDNHFVFEKG